MGEMSSRERVLLALSRKMPDRVPKDLSWGLSPEGLRAFRQRTGAEDPNDFFDVDDTAKSGALGNFIGENFGGPLAGNADNADFRAGHSGILGGAYSVIHGTVPWRCGSEGVLWA